MISVVGMSCIYPSSKGIAEFWENILLRRRSFRSIPKSRLDIKKYGSEDRSSLDKTYATCAALLDGYHFDWRKNLVPKTAYESTDLSHWLALDCAKTAVSDAGINLEDTDRSRFGAVVGNSLTGEVSRSHLMRLRWPYVREAILRGAKASDLDAQSVIDLLARTEQIYKSPFHTPNEDTLAGALSNVIAGRICNRLDLNGGGYTVDGACASSLLAIQTGCDLLTSGQLDFVLAGGVDISLDPLELVGFARTGALTPGEMLVYDKASSGFIPGEGCGFAVLMRSEDAAAQNLPVWAEIAGWGVSSDGRGGVTAPKAETQAMAIARCYDRAPFSASDLDFVEGHGTGTPVGDVVELNSILSSTMDAVQAPERQIGVTSIKTLIGHTKAAAGIAGFIKAVLGVNQRVLPPMAGPRDPNDLFDHETARIYPITRARRIAKDGPVRAGVSSAGFGGINCHVSVASNNAAPRALDCPAVEALAASEQSVELIIASAPNAGALIERLSHMAETAAGCAMGELSDFAAATALEDKGQSCRMAIAVRDTQDLSQALSELAAAVAAHGMTASDIPSSAMLAEVSKKPRIGFLFPGQGSQFLGMGWRLEARHRWAQKRLERWNKAFCFYGPEGQTPLGAVIDRPLERCFSNDLRAEWDGMLRDTRAAQPAIAMTSLQWFEFVQRCGIEPAAVAGHSLGEIPAMVAAELISEKEAINILKIRAKSAAPVEGETPGAMASLRTSHAVAEDLIRSVDGYLTIANVNAPDQIVIAGDATAIDQLEQNSHAQSVPIVRLNVQNAFHSKYMDRAAGALRQLAERSDGSDREAEVPFYSALRKGEVLTEFDPFDYLVDQVVGQVYFADTATRFSADVDLILEMGPGQVLSGLTMSTNGGDVPCHPLELASRMSDMTNAKTFGHLFIAGADIDWRAFYAGRQLRPFVPASQLSFIENPCEQLADWTDDDAYDLPEPTVGVGTHGADAPARAAQAEGPLPVATLLRNLIEDESGFGHDMMPGSARLVIDLNLDSIKIGEIRGKLAAQGVTFGDDTILSTGSIDEIVEMASRAAPVETHEPSECVAAPAEVPQPDVPVLSLTPRWRPIETPGAELGAAALRTVQMIHAEGDPLAKELGAALAAQGCSVLTGVADDQMTQRVVVILPGATTGTDNDYTVPGAIASVMAVAAPELAKAISAVIIEPYGPDQAVPLIAASVAQSVSLERPELPILSIATCQTDVAALATTASSALQPGALPLKLDGGDSSVLSLDRAEFTQDSLQCVEGEVILATGGAKGITAACMLALARETGSSVALLGRSDVNADAEVRETLERFAAEGLSATYQQCDITDPVSVDVALAAIHQATGGAPITGLIHGAGVNIASALATATEQAYHQELTTKCTGFAAVLGALDMDVLKLCVGFGSVIGVTGMHGNAGYAAANALLAVQLDKLDRAVPGCRVRCLAYGVWDEIGMGAKLGVVDRLRALDVYAIPAEEGIARFMAAAAGADAPGLMVVSGPMQGLPTWRAARRAEPAASEAGMLTRLVVDEPDHLLIARHDLTDQSAPWLNDHNFDGARLLPMVFALRSMGEAAAAMVGSSRLGRIDDIRISGPIVVPEGKAVTIETDVRRQEDGIACSLGLPGTAVAAPKFACHMDTDLDPGATFPERLPPGDQSVPDALSRSLYDWLLFQGPCFQRIEALTDVDMSDGIKRRAWLRLRRDAVETPLPDVFFLDAMLQAMQVLVPQDVCLPTGVGGVRFWPDAWSGGLAKVSSEILEKTEAGYLGRITAFDAETGAPLILIDGLELVAATRYEDRPDLPDLLKPLVWDRTEIARFVGEAAAADCHVSLGALDVTDRAERREAALAQISTTAPEVAAGLTWTDDGAPVFAGDVATGVSISHDGGRLLTAIGADVLGCDLQTLGRVARDWAGVLPEARRALWRDTARHVGNPDRAAAMIWAADEALVKAGAAGAAMTPLEMARSQMRFASPVGEVRAGIIQLALAGPAAIALCVKGETTPGAMPVVPPAAKPEAGPANPHGKIDHFHQRFSMSFKEALPPLRAATAPVIFGWVGDLRERAMEDISEPLVDAFLNRSKGILTNFTDLRVTHPPQFGRPIEAWVWMEQVLASQPSTFDLRFAFAQTELDGRVATCAEARQRLTWVHLENDGTPTIEPFPAFFQSFIDRRRPEKGQARWAPPLSLPGLAADPVMGKTRKDIHAVVQVDLDESYSNFVGNIYFSHLAVLTDRTCRQALSAAGLTPSFFARALRLDHLGEAMPGDSVEVRAYHRHLVTGGQAMGAEIVNLSRGGVVIAVAQLEYIVAEQMIAAA